MPDAPTTYNLIDPATGRAYAADESEVEVLLADGWKFESEAGAANRTISEVARDESTTLSGKVRAGTEGFLRGATLGLSDVATRAISGEEASRRSQRVREFNPGIATGAELAGAVAPSLLSGGTGVAGSIARATPTGALARGSLAIAGEGGGIARAVAAGAAEGAVQNVGMYVSDVALGNKDLSAEGAIGAGLDGAMWGGAAGGVLATSERAFTSARKLFANADVTDDAVKATERQAATEVDAALRDTDDMAQQARAKVRQIRKARTDVDPAAAEAEARIRAAKVSEAEARAMAQAERAGGAAANREAAQIRLERTKAGPKGRGKAKAGAEPTPDVPPVAADVAAPAADAPNDLERLMAESTTRLQAGESLGDLASEARTPRMMASEQIERALDDAAAQVDPDAAYFLDLANRLEDARDGVRATINPREYADRLRGRASSKQAEARASGKLTRDKDVERVMRPGAVSDGVEVPGIKRDSVSRMRDPYTNAEIEARTLERPAFLTPEGKGEAVLKGRHIAKHIAEGGDPTALEMSAMFDVGGKMKEARRVATGVDLIEAIGKNDPADLTEQIIASIRASAPDDPADLDAVINAFRKLDDVESEAVKVFGPTAPPGSSRRASGYADARTLRNEATQATTAQHAERLAADAASPQAGKIAPVPLDTNARAGIRGKVADAATALEVLGSLGVAGLPRPEDIPVIGPLLGLVLKARAGLMVARKLGGKLPATAEGEIAKRAAATRNRTRAAVHGLLGKATTTTRQARKVAPIAAVFAARLFEGGPVEERAAPRRRKQAPETKAERLYLARADELARSQQPGAIARAVNARLNVADPELRQAAIRGIERKLGFLFSKLPAGGSAPPLPTGEPETVPDRARLEEFARYVEAADDPAGVLERALGGDLSLEGVETLQAVYPELYAEARGALLERSLELQEAVPYRRRLVLSTLFQVPLDETMVPEYVAAMQSGWAAAPQDQAAPPPGAPPTPAIAGPVTLGERSMLGTDRIAQR